jgi:pyruvate formate lyase activating enzyme
MHALRVGGLTPFSATDYPGQLCAVIFCQGCPWRCGYCHNPHLLPSRGKSELDWSEVVAFLARRRGLLDAVVFSGGEPTAQHALADALREVKAMGFRIGLHTAGAYPARLQALLPVLDWVGMDIKAPFVDYSDITGVAASGEKALASARAILDSRVQYEFRTTVHPDQLSVQALMRIARGLAALGAARYVVQEFRSQGCADTRLRSQPGASFLSEAFCSAIRPLFAEFSLRHA